MSMRRSWGWEMALAVLCICCQVGIWKNLRKNPDGEMAEPKEVGAAPVVEAMRTQVPKEKAAAADLVAERRQERQREALAQLRTQEEMLAFAAEELSLQQLMVHGKGKYLVSSVDFVNQMNRFQELLEQRQAEHQEALTELEEVVDEMDCSGWSDEEQQALETYMAWRRRWATIIYDPAVSQEEKLAVAEEFPQEAFQIAGRSLIRQFKADCEESLKKYNQISQDLHFTAIHKFMYPGPMRYNAKYTDAQGRTHLYSVELF